MSESGIETKCIYNREGQCYFVESNVSKCNLCFNFKTFDIMGKKRKAYYNLFDYLKQSGISDNLFPKGDDEQDSLKLEQ
ncbi:MAG: hypothetical protein QXZ44_04275 [Ferroplasma sp.]